MTITLSPRILRLTVVVLLIATGVVAGMAVSAAMAGSVVEDTAYTAVTPCASFDSRTDTGTLAGKYTDSEIKTFQITGVAPLAQQGGVDCGVPAGAKAVLINVVAIQAETIGNLRAFATGDTGTGGIVNYSPVTPGMNNSNAVVIPLSAAGQLDIENNCGGCAGTSVHARGIVLGYYTDSLAVRVATLEALLADVTRTGLNVTFPGDLGAVNNMAAGNDMVAGNDILAVKDVIAVNNVTAFNDVTAHNDLTADNAPSTVLCPFCDLPFALLPGADLTGAHLRNANLTGADLRSADLNNAVLFIADLATADLTGADLTNANLSSADLTNANLTNANLTNADLRFADLNGADLNNANLTNVTWTQTRCPDGTNSETNGTVPESCIGHL